MKLYISNTFSFNMISEHASNQLDLLLDELEADEVVKWIERTKVTPVVNMSNPSTVQLFNAVVGANIQPSKADVVLDSGDTMLVMQYNGPKLEGELTKVSSGGKLRFFFVEVRKA